MKLNIRTIAIISICIFLMTGHLAYADDEISGFNTERIEAEIKLTVPNEIAQDVWDYLKKEYAEGNNYLDQYGTSFSTTFSEEKFVDTYFDTPKRELSAKQHGIRHRKRYVEDFSDPKELIQIKISHLQDQDIARTEIKFPVKHYKSEKNNLDTHPVIKLVKRGERSNFIERVWELNIDPLELTTAVTLTQDRRRVYIQKDNTAFATITLDKVNIEGEGNLKFIEIELELNEIGYTNATPQDRKYMLEINEKIKAGILESFPSITQDQTPKYNKALNLLQKDENETNIDYSKATQTLIILLAIFTVAGLLKRLIDHRKV